MLRLLQRQYPGDFWVNYWLADELNLSGGDRDQAVSFATAAVAIRPKSAAAHLVLAAALRRKGDSTMPIIHLNKAIELAPNYPFAHNDLGWTLDCQGKLDEAIACYKKAIELEPKYDNAHINLGLALSKQGSWTRPSPPTARPSRSTRTGPAHATMLARAYALAVPVGPGCRAYRQTDRVATVG